MHWNTHLFTSCGCCVKAAGFRLHFDLDVFSDVCIGGSLCLCHSPHGGILVHGGVAAGGDSAAANHPFPRPGHHGVQRSKTVHIHIVYYIWYYNFTCTFIQIMIPNYQTYFLLSCCMLTLYFHYFVSSLFLSRCVCSTWRTPTCCLSGAWWSP